MKRLLVLLAGLPGCGKTSLARQLVSVLPHETFLVCLDAIQAEEVLALKKEEKEKKEEDKDEDEVLSLKAWHQARRKALNQVKERFLQSFKEEQKLSETQALIVLVDDNFYYRSMRKPFQRVAQEGV
jgi:tRNA uridine 5-carbamoylmethylation protein Kti12